MRSPSSREGRLSGDEFEALFTEHNERGKIACTIYTKTNSHFCEVCAHLFVDPCYYIYRKNPPIHYIVFATPHKKKYLLQNSQLIPLAVLLCKFLVAVLMVLVREAKLR